MAKPKRWPGDEHRTHLWLENVMTNAIKAGLLKEETGGRQLCYKLVKKARDLALPAAVIRDIGSPEGWRWYSVGRSTPSKSTRTAVDNLFRNEKMGKQLPIGWIACGPGEVELSPVYAWSVNSSGGNAPHRAMIAKAEAKIWNRVEPDIFMPLLIAEITETPVGDLGYRHDRLGNMRGPSWPPILRLPTAIARTLKREELIPFPHIYDHEPYLHKDDIYERVDRFNIERDGRPCDAFTYRRRAAENIPTYPFSPLDDPRVVIDHLHKWSRSDLATREPGEVWAAELQLLHYTGFNFLQKQYTAIANERITGRDQAKWHSIVAEARHALKP